MLFAMNTLLPVAGAFFTMRSITGGFVTWLIIKAAFGHLPITWGIPTLVAMLAWQASAWQASGSRSKLPNFMLNFLLPATCMAIFMLHPVAGQAAPYALYWLIPITIWSLTWIRQAHHERLQNSPLLLALQSTFVAHAVGSIIWLFVIPTTPEQWLALIPLVAVERCTMAGIATLMFYGSHAVLQATSLLRSRVRT